MTHLSLRVPGQTGNISFLSKPAVNGRFVGFGVWGMNEYPHVDSPGVHALLLLTMQMTTHLAA